MEIIHFFAAEEIGKALQAADRRAHGSDERKENVFLSEYGLDKIQRRLPSVEIALQGVSQILGTHSHGEDYKEKYHAGQGGHPETMARVIFHIAIE